MPPSGPPAWGPRALKPQVCEVPASVLASLQEYSRFLLTAKNCQCPIDEFKHAVTKALPAVLGEPLVQCIGLKGAYPLRSTPTTFAYEFYAPRSTLSDVLAAFGDSGSTTLGSFLLELHSPEGVVRRRYRIVNVPETWRSEHVAATLSHNNKELRVISHSDIMYHSFRRIGAVEVVLEGPATLLAKLRSAGAVLHIPSGQRPLQFHQLGSPAASAASEVPSQQPPQQPVSAPAEGQFPLPNAAPSLSSPIVPAPPVPHVAAPAESTGPPPCDSPPQQEHQQAPHQPCPPVHRKRSGRRGASNAAGTESPSKRRLDSEGGQAALQVVLATPVNAACVVGAARPRKSARLAMPRRYYSKVSLDHLSEAAQADLRIPYTLRSTSLPAVQRWACAYDAWYERAVRVLPPRDAYDYMLGCLSADVCDFLSRRMPYAEVFELLMDPYTGTDHLPFSSRVWRAIDFVYSH